MEKFRKLSIFALYFFLLPGALFADTFTTSFTNPANYTYPNEIEVSGGLAKLKGSSLWNGLQGYWKMDDVSGQITDSSGNGNHGTNNGASYQETGKLNKALGFQHDYVQVPNSQSLNPGDDLTLSAWVNWNGASGDNNVITKETAYEFRIRNGYVNYAINPWAWRGGTSSQISPNTWNHIVITNDRDGQQKIYINGVNTYSTNSGGAVRQNNNHVRIGARGNGSASAYFYGLIDETAIWNRVLTPSEITELYNAGNGKEITQYSNGTFTISKTNGNSASSISQFTNFQVTPGVLQGTLHFQLSTDGTHWKYWDGNTWTNAQTNNDTNTEAEVNAHISSFPTNTNSIYVKTFLTGDGTQRTEIDEINIQYETNNAPTDIKLNGADSISIQEGTNTGTSIATLTTTDADAGDTHTYSLVNGTGDEDNPKFTLTGDQLKLNFTPDFENPTDLGDTPGNNTYSIRIQTNDGNGGTYQKSFIITVTDVDENAPVISLLGSPVITIIQGDTYNDPGATAQDNEDGDITAHIIVVNPVDTNTPGTYIISYNVSDSAGNVAQEVVRTVVVKEKRKRRGKRRILREKVTVSKKEVKELDEGVVGMKEDDGKTLCTKEMLLHQNMKQGDRDGSYSSWEKGVVHEVALLQKILMKLGYKISIIDGIFGPQTHSAVLQLQHDANMKFTDGLVGEETRSYINAKCIGQDSLKEDFLKIGLSKDLSKEKTTKTNKTEILSQLLQMRKKIDSLIQALRIDE